MNRNKSIEFLLNSEQSEKGKLLNENLKLKTVHDHLKIAKDQIQTEFNLYKQNIEKKSLNFNRENEI